MAAKSNPGYDLPSSMCGMQGQKAAKSNPGYDLTTPVTFFLAGLGVGAILALVFSPRVDPVEIHSSHAPRSREYSPAL